MPLVLALGLNLWIVAAALPLMLALHQDALNGVGLVVLTLLAPIALGVGVWQRSTVALLLAVPVLLVLPLALAGADTSARVLPAAAFVPQAASLAAYLIAVARALSRDDRSAAAAPAGRALRQDALPPRWRRRLRVYRGLTVTAVAFPSLLLCAVDLSPGFAATLGASFGARAPRVQALLTVAVGLLWMGLWRAYLLGPLHAHLQHDRDLLAAIERDRRHARRGQPSAGFYFAVAVALAAMSAVIWQRAR
jgi:hypothetical protein